MSEQPDFTENTDLTASLSPEDLAEMEARMASIASRPAPTEENRKRFAEMREGSRERVDARIAAAEEAGGAMRFDTSTPEGHIDAVTFLRTTLIGIGLEVRELIAAGDQVGVSDLFQQAHDLWELATPAVQFNVLLDFVLSVAGVAAEEGQ